MAPATHVVSPQWSRRLLAELDDADRRAELLARPLTREQLNWRPAPGIWSVGQCLKHLLVANEVYLPAIATALKGRPQSPVPEIAPGWFGRWFIRSFIDPSSQNRRVRAPKKIEPGREVETSVLESFLQSNQEARELVRMASNYDVNRIRFPNPFVPLVRFTSGTGFEIVTKHQRRHLMQAERVRNSADFPKQ